MSTIKAYSNNGDEFEKRNFGSILHPNYGMIEFLATTAGTPVAKFTMRDTWWGIYRQGGIYNLGSAEAEIERHADRKPSGEFFHNLEIECTNLEDGRELYRLIRAGEILPTTSFENKQIDSPIPQLRDLVRVWWRSVVTKIRSHMSA